MTTKIFSKINPNILLHMIVRDIPEGRINLCPDDQFLQVATLNLPSGTSFKAHQHNWNIVDTEARIAQECWIVISGGVKVYHYDLDGTLLQIANIWPGDASITFQGGHNYLILERDTRVYEIKTGPYKGQELDKTFL